MKAMIDANLSPRIVNALRSAYFDAMHAIDLVLLTAGDDEIFDRAAADETHAEHGPATRARVAPSRESAPRRESSPPTGASAQPSPVPATVPRALDRMIEHGLGIGEVRERHLFANPR